MRRVAARWRAIRWPWVSRVVLDAEMRYARSLAEQLESARRERGDLAARLKTAEEGRRNALHRAAAGETRAALLLGRLGRVDEQRAAQVRADADRLLARIDEAVA